MNIGVYLLIVLDGRRGSPCDLLSMLSISIEPSYISLSLLKPQISLNHYQYIS